MTEPDNTHELPAADPEVSQSGHLKVPLWIKLMWLGGILWVLWYIFFGLKSTPTTWT